MQQLYYISLLRWKHNAIIIDILQTMRFLHQQVPDILHRTNIVPGAWAGYQIKKCAN